MSLPQATGNANAYSEPPNRETSVERMWRSYLDEASEYAHDLHPRYHPRWQPSWTKSRKDFFTVEDGQATITRAVMDATHGLDNLQEECSNDPPPPGPVSTLFGNLNNVTPNLPGRFSSYFRSDLPKLTRAINKKRLGVVASDSNMLPSTLLAWLRNMNRLSSLIDQLSDLAATAPQEQRQQLNIQVAVLRKDFKKQQECYAAFLRLTKEYADRFLSDISDEIQQQSSFLDAMENRLHMAENLRKKVVDLRESYELGTLKCMKKVRDTVLLQALPEDVKLFKEMDTLIDEIRQCLREMNKFWDDEVRRVTKAFRDRHVDPEDIERWKEFRESLGQTIEHWETRSADNAVSLYPDTRPSVHELGRIASFLSDKVKAAQDTLERVWLSPSAALEYVRPDVRSLILQARVKSSSNRKSCLEFLRESFRYGQRVAMTCNAFASYSPFFRSRNSQDLVDDATRLGVERMEISAETAVQTWGVRTINSVHKKSTSLLRKMAHGLDASPSCISAWVTELDTHSTFPAFNIKDLLRISRVWLKNRDTIEQILAALSPLGEPDSSLPLLETRA